MLEKKIYSVRKVLQETLYHIYHEPENTALFFDRMLLNPQGASGVLKI